MGLAFLTFFQEVNYQEVNSSIKPVIYITNPMIQG